MIADKNKERPIKRKRRIYMGVAILVNVGMCALMHLFSIPLYLDCIGTMAVTATCGIVPGLIVAVLTHLFCGIIQKNAVYYMLISTLIVVTTFIYIREKFYEKSKVYLVLYLLVITAISGGIGTVFQLVLLGDFQFETVRQTAAVLNETTGMPLILGGLITNLGLNLVDKGLSTMAMGIILYLIPKEKRKAMWNANWQMTPLSKEEIRAQERLRDKGELSVRIKITALMIFLFFIHYHRYFVAQCQTVF